jgi:hypothetical protein
VKKPSTPSRAIRLGVWKSTRFCSTHPRKLAQVVSVSPDGLGRVILSMQRSGKGKTPSFRSLVKLSWFLE